MGRSQRRELSSRLDVLLTHLLKWAFQPVRRGESWICTILEQRRGIALVLRDNPSLRPTLDGVLRDSYAYAVKRAALETGLPATTFPASCPWTLEQVLDEDWLPTD